jgi:predicted GNAT family acetyltransferase
MTTPGITHDAEHSRFTADTRFGEAVLEYMRDGKRIIFTHTGVPPEAERKGIGAALAKAGLDYARDEGLVVRPMCPFVASYVERNPEYQPLLGAR